MLAPGYKIRFFIIASFILLILFVSKAYYDTNCIEIRRYRIENSPLGEVLEGTKVAFLSDLHIKRIGLIEKKVLEILNEEKPALVLLAGDFVGFDGSYGPVSSFLGQLNPPLGAYAVLGNTEYSNENGSCVLCHREKSKSLKEIPNPFFLRNSSVPLRIGERILNIAGVDDPVNQKSDLRTTRKSMKENGPSILLAHSPEVFEEASRLGFDLLLSGHTHGGQIFITRYLRKVLPLEPDLEYLEGFFQKRTTLMYVSRGIGTGFFPFRFGVKPEIAFLEFSNNPTPPSNPGNRINPVNSPDSPLISDRPGTTFFAGLSISSFMDTFGIPKLFDSFSQAAGWRHDSTLTSSTSAVKSNSIPTNPINSMNPRTAVRLFDFEDESDLERLNWECHKWFELSDDYVTSGKHSLKISLPPGRYRGINFKKIPEDWTGFNFLKMDTFNPSGEDLRFHIRIDDNQSGWEYANRFDMDLHLKRGMNHISIPAVSIITNLSHRALNLKSIRKMMVFIPHNTKQREIYIDHIRLE